MMKRLKNDILNNSIGEEKKKSKISFAQDSYGAFCIANPTATKAQRREAMTAFYKNRR
jgi:hypothetical protein